MRRLAGVVVRLQDGFGRCLGEALSSLGVQCPCMRKTQVKILVLSPTNQVTLVSPVGKSMQSSHPAWLQGVGLDLGHAH